MTHHSELAALLDDAVEDGVGADVRAHHAVHPADAVCRRGRRVVLREHPRLGADGRRRRVELLRQDISKIQSTDCLQTTNRLVILPGSATNNRGCPRGGVCAGAAAAAARDDVWAAPLGLPAAETVSPARTV